MTPIPGQYLDLVKDKAVVANLATVMPDGTPQVTPLWFDYTDGRIRVNTARGRVKDRNMSRNRHVALSIVDPANAYRYLQIRGKVVRESEEGADAHIDSLAKKYLNKDSYPFRSPTEKRVTYEIEPLSVQVMG